MVNLHFMHLLTVMYNRSLDLLAREFIKIPYYILLIHPTIVTWIAHNHNAKIYSSYNLYQMFTRVTEIFSPTLKKWSLSDSFVPDFS